MIFLLWWPTSRSHRRRDICVQLLAGQCLDPTACLSLVCVLTLELVPSNCTACCIEVMIFESFNVDLAQTASNACHG